MFNVNDKVRVMDHVTEIVSEATVIFVEYDGELEFSWIYVKYEDESLNNKYDPRFGMFGDMIESISGYIDFNNDDD